MATPYCLKEKKDLPKHCLMELNECVNNKNPVVMQGFYC